jgi:heat shock protein HslJ
MRRTFVIVAAVGVLVAVAPATISAAASARPPLRGTNWVLTSRVSIGTPLDDVAVNAVFGSERVEGTSGCNGYSSSYTTDGSHMTIANDGVSTQIACGGAAGKVEPQYLDALTRVRRWRIRGQTLTLSNTTGRRLLVYRASTGAQALRGSWDVTSVYTGDAISSPVPGSTLTLDFTAEKASGDSGCNTFTGPFEVGGADHIAIGPLTSTLRACADAAVGTQEQQYLAALGLAKRYRVTGNQLTVFRDGGTIAVTATRAKS